MVHFIGKDILYFHALFWPAMLKFSGHRTPSRVYAHGFLTVNGEKMSKSRGTFITAESYLAQGLNPEWLRYYYAAKLGSTMEDIDLNLDDFVARVNSDLVGKYVNIASRAAGFLTKQFGGKLLPVRPTLPQVQAVQAVADSIARVLRHPRVRQGVARGHAPDRSGQRMDRPGEAVGARAQSRERQRGCTASVPRS